MTEEKLLKTERNISWLPQPNEALTMLSAQLPPLELTVTAFVLAFSENRLLQTQLVKRGWDLVGGHVEVGELPEQSVRREAYEEAGVQLGQLSLLGYQRLRLLASPPVGYRYPYPDSYQVFYQAQIVSFDDFSATNETFGRGLFSPTEAAQLPWVQAHKDLYLAALAVVEKEIK